MAGWLKRLGWFGSAMALALALAVAALQTPRPLDADAPATTFSAGRAMQDVRQIARRPHPVGSADHGRVRGLLLRRMEDLGLAPTTQSGPLTQASLAVLRRRGGDPAAVEATNLIGVLPGENPSAKAIALVAHYDTVPRSPGAADDSAGVAAILEAVRAIKARGPAKRDLIVLFTDAEEIGLDGARLFFGHHPLRSSVGAVVNLEARGGGGRAIMFETGPGNGGMIKLFAEATGRASGGPASNSLAVFVYEQMPNNTDFALPKAAGIAGVNLAFLGRPGQYHSPSSTPAALDQGSLQHIGSQALEIADALLRAPALPARADDAVYADLFGLAVLAYPPAAGWGLLGLAALLTAIALTRAAALSRAGVADLGRGALDGVWFVSAALVILPAAGALAGRADTALEAYHRGLERLLAMEAAVAAALLALASLLVLGRGRIGRLAPVLGLLAIAGLDHRLGRLDATVIVALMAALALSLATGLAARTVAGAWLGLIVTGLLLATVVQAAAPEAAFLLTWPVLLAACAAALAPRGPGPGRRQAFAHPAFAATVVGGGWLAAQSHGLFLGVGAEAPGVLAVTGLMILMLARPLGAAEGDLSGDGEAVQIGPGAAGRNAAAQGGDDGRLV